MKQAIKLSANTVCLAHIAEDGREQTVYDHLQGTAERAAEFAAPFGGDEQARLAGLLHDIGKYSGAFQKRLHGGPKVDHATAGAQAAWNELHQPEIAFCVAGHHSGLPDGGTRTDPAGAATLCGRLKKEVPPCGAWRAELGALPAARGPQLPNDAFADAFYTRMLYSCLVDADFLDTEAFMDGRPAPRGEYEAIPALLEKLTRYIDQKGWWDAKGALNAERTGILHRCFACGREAAPGLFSLTVPTGGGKTVSSLAFALAHAAAHDKRRVIYVIPYTSIIDQTAEVFGKILGPDNVIEHHSGVDVTLAEDDTSSAAYRKILAAENWDAPVIVTTAVQFFESLFAARASRCRKLHNIADSVVIFDEAQTLPVPYLRPCVAAIGELVQRYGVTAVLCTATQPALEPLFAEFSPALAIREICPDTERLYALFRRTTLQNAGELTEDELAAQLCAAPQALCVVNRRATAQNLYALLPEEGRYCLTTLLCPADRKRLLAEIRQRLQDGLPCRVVSTSLIEAGVDVDFPAAWREEAGLDSILQTAGRCNREGKRAAGDSVVTVFRLAGQKALAMLHQNIDSARRVLSRFADPAAPAAIADYFSFYRGLKGDAALDEQEILAAFRRGAYGQPFPFATVAENFRLIDTPTKTVYLPIGEGAKLLDALRFGTPSRALYRKLGQYAVNVYPQHLRALLDAGAADPLDETAYRLTDLSLYSSSTGLRLDVETGRGLFIYGASE